MNRLTNNDSFSAYNGQYIQMNDNGTIRKYFVQTIDKDSLVWNAGLLKENTYAVLGLSPKQSCGSCDDICRNNIPYINVEWNQYIPFNPYGSSEVFPYNERYEILLNNTSLGVIETSALSLIAEEFPPESTFYGHRVGIVTFIPTSTDGLVFDSAYASIYNHNTTPGNSATTLSSIPDIFIKNGYNEFTIRPLYADNSALTSAPYDVIDANKFYTRFKIALQVAKTVNTSTSTSAISCISWNMYHGDFYTSFPNKDLEVIGTRHNWGELDGFAHTQNSLSTLGVGTVSQAATSVFLYLDPCEIPTGLGNYTIDPEIYYEDDGFDTLPGYVNNGSQDGYDTIENGPAIFKKMVFFTDYLKTTTITLYYGRDSANPWPTPYQIYDIQLGAYVSMALLEGYFFEDYGFTKYNGGVILNTVGNTDGFYEYHTRLMIILNGLPTTIQNI